MARQEPRKRCVWCGELDWSVGKIETDPESCFTCDYLRCNLKHMAQTSRGRKFLHEILASAPEIGRVS